MPRLKKVLIELVAERAACRHIRHELVAVLESVRHRHLAVVDGNVKDGDVPLLIKLIDLCSHINQLYNKR